MQLQAVGQHVRGRNPGNPKSMPRRLNSLATCFAVALLFLDSIAWVSCGDTDFRVMITTDLEDGVDVLCQSADEAYKMRKRSILPGDCSYTFPFDEFHPTYLSQFLCTVIDSVGNEMTFTAWDTRMIEKPWKFPQYNEQRDVRWAVNNAGAWVYLKGRKHVESIMRWMLAAVWPHLQICNNWPPTHNWPPTGFIS